MRGGGLRLLADCTVYDRDDVQSSRARFDQFRFEKMVLDPGLISSLSSRSLVAKSETHSEIKISLYQKIQLKGKKQTIKYIQGRKVQK